MFGWYTLPAVSRYHFDLAAFECWTKTIAFQVFHGPIDQFGHVVDTDNLPRRLSVPRGDEVVKYGGKVARATADVENFRPGLEIGQ